MMSESTFQAWYVVTIVLQPTKAEALAEWIRNEWGVEPVQLERPGATQVWLECYFDTEEMAQAAMRRLGDVPDIEGVGERRCDSRDWHTFWQTHFKPHAIGRRLFIQPTWDDTSVPDGRTLLRMLPGLSFGTGEHFTTRFCLESIDQLAMSVETCWDVGSGSGILGIAAALLGVPHVLGTDNDPMCLTQATENALLNGVANQTIWRMADIETATDGTTRYDLVCANLFARLLCKVASTLWASTGKHLVLSGIREQEVDEVANQFLSLGATEMVRDGDGEWAGLIFRHDD